MNDLPVRVRRVGAVARHDLRIFLRDPMFLVIFTLMPLAYMAFTKGAFGAPMAAEYPGRNLNGSEQVVPGAAVLFSGFLVGNIGFSVFREHGWFTWDRLRASPLSTTELLVGKAIIPVASLVVQLSVLFVGGAILFDLHVTGSWVALAAVSLGLIAVEVTLGFALLALCSSVLQLNAATNVGAMLFGGLGGAVTPVESLPGWAQAVAPFTPAYWAMQGYTGVIVEGDGPLDVARPVGVLLVAALAFAALAATRFRVADAKTSWA